MTSPRRSTRRWLAGVALSVVSACAGAGEPDGGSTGAALVRALQGGGYNLYFRHAATDWSRSDRVSRVGDWTSCDPDHMRQLSDAGRATASRVGQAIRALGVPVGRVLASPYCRTVETARLLGLGEVETTTDIMNLRVAEYFGGREAIAERARTRLAVPPRAGTNTVLVAHGNVARLATGVYPDEGEAAVFRPRDGGRFEHVGNVSPEAWQQLATDGMGTTN